MGEPEQFQTQLLAVLLVDQVGSTAFLQKVGDIRANEVRLELQLVLREAVENLRGRVVVGTGDGLLAVFDGASHAIDSGLAMHRLLSDAKRSKKIPRQVEIRVGVAVGDVTIGDETCHGSAANEAAVLEAAAPPGTLMCTDLTRILSSGRSEAVFDRQSTVESAEIDEPIEVWIVTPPGTDAASLPALPEGLAAGGRFDYVGRVAELAQLKTAWRSADDDQQISAVLVGGEPGVGKSRLVRELALSILEDGARVLYGRCEEGPGVPYQPIAQALGQFVTTLESSDNGPDINLLGRQAGELVRLRPQLRTLLSSPETVQDASPDAAKLRLYDAIADWLTTAAQERPTLLVIDDLHWADEPTAQLLRHLLRSGASASLCVVVTYRDTEADESGTLHRFLADMARLDTVNIRSLSGLTVDEIAELVASSSGSDDQIDAAATATRLEKQTAGNPFFIAELLADKERDDGATSTNSEVVVDRVKRLHPNTQKLLTYAAVASREVGIDVLAVAANMDRGSLVDAADDAFGAGILLEEAEPPVRYRFQHDLVRSTLYHEMSLAERGVLHHELGTAIETVYRRNLAERVDDLAFHFIRSSDPADVDRAITASRSAASNADQALSFSSAVEHLTNAVDLLDRSGSTQNDQMRGQLLLDLGIMKRKAGDADFRGVLRMAAHAAIGSGDSATVATAALANNRGYFTRSGQVADEAIGLIELGLEAVGTEDSKERAKLLSNLSAELSFSTDVDAKLAASDESLAIAERLQDGPTLTHVINQRIATFWSPSGLDHRIELSERLRSLADDLKDPRLEYRAAAAQFQAAMESGDFGLVDRCLQTMMAGDATRREPAMEAYLDLRRAVRSVVAGDLEAAEQFAKEYHRLAETAGVTDAATFYVSQLFGVRFHQGRLGELEQIFAEGAAANPGLPSMHAATALIYCETDQTDLARAAFGDLADRAGELLHDLSWLVTTGLMADVCFQLRDQGRAATLHKMMAPYREQYIDNATNWLGSTERCLAMLEHLLGDVDAADASFTAALTKHEAIPAPVMAARTKLEWAESLLDRPKPNTDRAEDLLESVTESGVRFGLARVSQRSERLRTRYLPCR